MKQSSLFLLLLPCLLVVACSPSRPRGILGEGKMTDVLVDFHLAQGMAEAQGESQDINRYRYIQAVFRKHRITEAEFDSSMVYYSGRAEELTHIYGGVVKRVQAEAERLGLDATAMRDKFASLTSEGDTANIWLGKDFACLTANPVQCVYSFQMKTDSTFHPGDKFIWRFNSQFVARSMAGEAIAQLNFHYGTDTVVSVTDLIQGRSGNELRHYPSEALDSLSLSSVSGFIYLPPASDAGQPKPLLISNMMLIRMHRKVESVKLKIESDSLAVDTLSHDTVPEERGERLSPLQVRESQPKERKIHVVKENPNPIHPERGIPERTNRRRR